MSNASDFVIENGVLKRYVGKGGNVVIPDGVVEIGGYAFANLKTLPDGRRWISQNNIFSSVIMPASVEHIGAGAFAECTTLSKVVFSSGLKIIDDYAFERCHSLGEIILPATLERIGKSAFFGHMSTKILEIHSENLSLPEGKLSIFQYAPYATLDYILFAPHLSFSVLKDHGLAEQAAKTFLKRHSEYDADIAKEYLDYISNQRKKLLPIALENDDVELLQKLTEAKKITEKNFVTNYLLPAKQCGAEKCEAFLESIFGKQKTENATVNPLWDGKHFSIDGKKLIKCPETFEDTTYFVPEGTIEIGEKAFFMPSVQCIILPESVTTIRDWAFVAKGGKPLFIKLPDGVKKLPANAFVGGFFSEDDGLPDSTKYYYIATTNKSFLDLLSKSSYAKGERFPVYLGGPLDDAPQKIKSFVMKGFLYACEHKFADLSQWKDSYAAHIKRNEDTYIQQAKKNMYLLRWMVDEQVLSQKGVQALLPQVNRRKNPEAIAALLDYQEKRFGNNRKNEELILPEFDSASQKKQKIQPCGIGEEKVDGIKGMTFVATGEMVHFGQIDEYTGAHDLSDLKKFIEAHGGFLRSAVSSKTDYLICNDPSSTTTKTQKARELGTPIISEEEFLKMVE